MSVQNSLVKASIFIKSSNSLIASVNRTFNALKKTVLHSNTETLSFISGDLNIKLCSNSTVINGNLLPQNYDDVIRGNNVVTMDVVIAAAAQIDNIIDVALEEWKKQVVKNVKEHLEPLRDTTFLSNL